MNTNFIKQFTKTILQNNLLQFSSRKASHECDIAIVGGNLGAVLANQLYYVLDSNQKIMLFHENSNMEISTHRPLYEQGKLDYQDISLNTKDYIDSMLYPKKTGIKRFLPQNNQLLLKSGETVNYRLLVIAMGLSKNISQIKGFQQALASPNSSVTTCLNTINDSKSKGSINNTQGETIFYIPPDPYTSSIENLNFFLMQNTNMATGKGKISLINANSTFCSHSFQTNIYIKNEIQARKIQSTLGMKLIEILPMSNKAIFQNLSTGKLQTKEFSKLYSLIPCKSHFKLISAGLTTPNGYLNVNKYTLKHNQYDNIFGLGDVNDIPTTKSLYSGLAQLKVVRNNVEKVINNHSRQMKYYGYTTSPLLTSNSEVKWLSHNYDGKMKVSKQNMNDFISEIDNLKKIYKLKSWRSQRVTTQEKEIEEDQVKVFANINLMYL